MEAVIRLSVGRLVGFLTQSGSIDNRFGGADRALKGTRIHRKLQKEAGDSYRSEVFLSLDTVLHGLTYHIEGRADGMFDDDSGRVIDEIKSTGYPLELVEEDFSATHWAQAMVYGYLCCVREELPGISARLTYCQVDTGETKRFTRSFTLDELERFYLNLLEQYEKWALMQEEWVRTRTDSIRVTAFPFGGYRAGQREMAVAVYRTIERGERLFCQAPTGIGKTMSSLFPAVKAMGAGMTARLFYLTAKTITRTAAEEAFSALKAAGARLRTITLTAKDKVCFLPERDCNPLSCPWADGYYDRVNDAVFSLLTTGGECMTRAAIEQCARENQLCPFELALDLTLWCDAIVCDYNYLFDPVVYLKRFFSEPGDYVFLIDEAHNLVDRARDMYTAPLDKAHVLDLRRVTKPHPKLFRALGKINAALVALRKECGESGLLVREVPDETLLDALSHFFTTCGEWLEEHKESPLRAEILPFYFETGFLLRIAELYDDHFTTFTSTDGRNVLFKLLCLDPSALLDASMRMGRASILFSATLSPADYYAAVLGGVGDGRTQPDTGDAVHRAAQPVRKYALPSPFPPENLLLLCANRVSTLYRDRDESILPIAQLLHALIGGRVGNYLFFFPSYPYMNSVHAAFHERWPEVDTLLQVPRMDEEARETFLARFASGGEQPLAGFCVLGGIYSEGIDLCGERLIGAAVVGVGLPQVNGEQEVLRDYYERTRGAGFDFAYRYPGMNKVLQALGRVIRSGTDRGVALLIDARFSKGAYRMLFPPHLSPVFVRDAQDAEAHLTSFWKEGSQ